MTTALHRLGAGIVVTLLALGTAEIAARTVWSEDALLDAWERSDGWVTWEKDGPAPQPNRTDTLQDGPYTWRVRVDARGLREGDFAEGDGGAGPAARTFLALGDSWVFGNSVDQGHTLADVVEARLPGLEVLNAGLVGASAFDMLRRWQALTLDRRPDGVLLGRPHNARRTDAVRDRRRAWYDRARPGPLLRARAYLLVRHWLTPWRGPRYAAPSHTDDALLADLSDLTAIVTDARTAGAPVWFVAFPDGLGVPADPRWSAALTALGVPVVAPVLPDRACWGFDDLGHPSARGARVIGELVAAAIAGIPAIEARCDEE